MDERLTELRTKKALEENAGWGLNAADSYELSLLEALYPENSPMFDDMADMINVIGACVRVAGLMSKELNDFAIECNVSLDHFSPKVEPTIELLENQPRSNKDGVKSLAYDIAQEIREFQVEHKAEARLLIAYLKREIENLNQIQDE